MTYALILLPEFSLIFLGYLICRTTALNRSVWSQVDALVYYLLFPTLLFHSIIKSHLDLADASRLLTGGLLILASGVLLAYSLPYLPGLRQHIQRREHAAAAQVAFRFNSFIGLPSYLVFPPIFGPVLAYPCSGILIVLFHAYRQLVPCLR